MNVIQRFKLNWYDDREIKRLVRGGEYAFSKTPVAILDLGAHKGFASEHFAQLYPTIPIHAYEPNPRLFAQLQRRVKGYPNVQCFNEAIAAQDGSIAFPVAERAVSSSVFVEGKTVSIRATSLQTAIKRLGTHVPVSVKSDIEGSEFLAFSDLSHVQEIVGEVHPEKAGRTMEEFRKVLAPFKNVVTRKGKSLFSAV